MLENQDRPFAANITAGTGMSSVRYTSWVSKTAAASYQGYVNIGMSNRIKCYGYKRCCNLWIFF